MIKYLWAVIDPKLDRPCFSSSPPPATLERTEGMRVLRFEYNVPDPTPGHVEGVSVLDEESAIVISRDIYRQSKGPLIP